MKKKDLFFLRRQEPKTTRGGMNHATKWSKGNWLRHSIAINKPIEKEDSI